MATIYPEGDLAPSPGDLQHLLSQKASDLFSLCDAEEKGFVTKRDMQRLRGELPLDPDQLEAVFDTLGMSLTPLGICHLKLCLDADGNGYLTLEEFTDGFSSFLGVGAAAKDHLDDDGPEDDDTIVDPDAPKDDNNAIIEEDEEEEFR